VHCTGRAAFLFAVMAIELNGALFWGRQSGVSRNFHEKTPDVTHFQTSNLWENHILLRGPVIYFRGEEPEKGQAWRKCG
jgi:hypothetical protein